MITIMVVGIIIVIVVLLLSVLTTSKAYTFKHTVDPLEGNPHLDTEKEEKKSEADK
ncbi:YtzI protein [Neobacillus terrae]|uniref:YtzI protein n=1 Tax=Neobacillus terrae TaxID=3034837 RepID=UPI001409B6B9|nr:YtzI protein [Neobacillus terrae]NHM33140.1 YtzI protein [Neobacillus terrae]